MKFSIIIPLFNKKDHIKKTIDSVIAQSFSDYEILVVDDGSTDHGGDVVKDFLDSRIRVFQQKNSGVSSARNKGIEEALGEWIVFLDADDWQHPKYLETLFCLINKYPDFNIVSTHYKSISYLPGWENTPWDIPSGESKVEIITNLPVSWLRGTLLFTGSIAVKAAILKNMQPCFPVGESCGEDLDLWFRLAEKFPVLFTDTPLIARIWVADGLSVTHKLPTEPPFIFRMEERVKSGAMPHRLMKSSLRFINEYRINLARAAIYSNRRFIAMRLLWRAKGGYLLLRWWISLGMIIFFPGALVEKWQRWRRLKNNFTV